MLILLSFNMPIKENFDILFGKKKQKDEKKEIDL